MALVPVMLAALPLLLASALPTSMELLTTLLRALLALLILYRPSDLLPKMLVIALLTSMEMPQPVLQDALRVLVAVLVMLKPQEVLPIMRLLASAQ
jgi:hypothetical protein